MNVQSRQVSVHECKRCKSLCMSAKGAKRARSCKQAACNIVSASCSFTDRCLSLGSSDSALSSCHSNRSSLSTQRMHVSQVLAVCLEQQAVGKQWERSRSSGRRAKVDTAVGLSRGRGGQSSGTEQWERGTEQWEQWERGIEQWD